MKFSLFLLLSLFIFETIASAQPCSCRKNFDFLTAKIRLNYSGYQDKVTADKLAEFEQFTAKHRQMADTAATETSCFRVLSDWERWFKDGHVQLSINFSNTKTDTAAVRAQYENTEYLNITEEDLIISLIENSYKGPIEGIWQNAEGNYRVGIHAENGPQPHPERDFVGFILKADSVYWMPGQVKFELKKCAAPDQFSALFHARS